MIFFLFFLHTYPLRLDSCIEDLRTAASANKMLLHPITLSDLVNGAEQSDWCLARPHIPPSLHPERVKFHRHPRLRVEPRYSINVHKKAIVTPPMVNETQS